MPKCTRSWWRGGHCWHFKKVANRSESVRCAASNMPRYPISTTTYDVFQCCLCSAEKWEDNSYVW